MTRTGRRIDDDPMHLCTGPTRRSDVDPRRDYVRREATAVA